MKTVQNVVWCSLLPIFVAAGAQAQTIYRWVDEKGGVHFSDAVPDAYKKIAKPVDAAAMEPTPAERDAAAARAATLKAEASAIIIPTPVNTPSRNNSAAVTTPASGAFKYDVGNCKAWWKRFARSKACFSGVTLPDGSPAPGAFQRCGDDVPNPTPTCGAPESAEGENGDDYLQFLNTPPRHRH